LLVRGVLEGHAAIAVQPRGDVETKRALEILEEAQPIELRERDLDKQGFEHAAAASESPPIAPLVAKVLLNPRLP
jgi:hypothetical protein